MKLEQLASHHWFQSVEIENYSFRDVVHCSKYFIFDLISYDLNMLERVLEKDPQKRMKLEQLASHPWVMQIKLGHRLGDLFCCACAQSNDVFFHCRCGKRHH